jgi:fibronectin type 3 domain-containing protein
MVPDRGARLNPPQNLKATPGNQSVLLAWGPTNSASEAEYTVHQKTALEKEYRSIVMISGMRYEVKNLKNGQSYSFYITASLNQVAESAPSNTVTAAPGL